MADALVLLALALLDREGVGEEVVEVVVSGVRCLGAIFGLSFLGERNWR